MQHSMLDIANTIESLQMHKTDRQFSAKLAHDMAAMHHHITIKSAAEMPSMHTLPSMQKKAQTNGSADVGKDVVAQAQKYTSQLSAIPELKEYGNVLKSSSIIELTESETEYVVSAVKHVFAEHVVFQYDVKNTLPDTVLEDISIVASPEDEEEAGLEEEFIIPIPSLRTDEPGTVYVSFKKSEGAGVFSAASFTNVLKFTTKEIDPTTNEPDPDGYEDEYQVENLELSGADYVVPAFAGSFDHIWEQTGANGEEASETLQLSNTKSIAGKWIYFQNCKNSCILTTCPRCYGTAHCCSFAATTRRNRGCALAHNPSAQALW